MSISYTFESNNIELTSDELDYFENVIRVSLSSCLSKGYVTSTSNNTSGIIINNNSFSCCEDSEPSFKGQLSKYFPESIRSNFNEVDFSELETSQLFLSESISCGN